jgi:5-oxoprolinase (ATP-hydrolysing)
VIRYAQMHAWRFFIDRGGTFTDCLAFAPNGSSCTVKVLSSEDSPIVAIRRAMQLPEDAEIPPCDVRMGTTIATNALLERRGARTLLVVTEGFADLLEIGTQARPDIFSLHIQKPEPLCEMVIETKLRADHLGQPLVHAPEPDLLNQLRAAKARGLESVAIVVAFGHLAPEMEIQVRDLAILAGFEHVSMSHEIANERGLLKRAQTTVIDAYLRPTLTWYFARLSHSLTNSSLLVLQSSGDLVSPEQLRGPASLLSGPAGGVVACEALVRELGLSSAVGFDMGGTSTDVCRVEPNELPLSYEMHINGTTAVVPTLDVHTVAAGGGSVCTYDEGRFSVGPHSAGAVPGPACYGHPDARHLTVTDVNLLLGRLLEHAFPFPLQRSNAEALAQHLLSEVRTLHPQFSQDDVLRGVLQIANTNMAEAIREISLGRGFDVRKETLIVFGGAGGQHACAVARELGIREVVFPTHSGIFSACGMASAARAERYREDGGHALLSPATLAELAGRFAAMLARSASKQLQRSEFHLDLRYQGSEARLTVAFDSSVGSLREDFEKQHAARFGYTRKEHPIEVVALHLTCIVEEPRVLPSSSSAHSSRAEPVLSYAPVRMLTCDGWNDAVPVYHRSALAPDVDIIGPACIIDDTGCLILEPGFRMTCSNGHLICRDTRIGVEATTSAAVDVADPVTLELMGQAFMSVAKQMGVVLQRTASSTNIRERLDYSCAVFDRDASLIANAPHIPVHLGAMGETVRHVASVHQPQPGDVFVSNDPAHGGSHLPDVTVISPVFNPDGELRYWVANRGHHSDIGGITPGSMPAFSSSLSEEGVVLSALRLVRNGQLRSDLEDILTAGPHPARNPKENIRDLEAQIAANHVGCSLMLELESRFGAEVVPRYMAHLQDYAAHLTEALIRSLPEASRAFTDGFDDGTELSVTLQRKGSRLMIEFRAPPPVPGNNNAPRSVTVAAVLYVLRCLLGTRLPLNAGCLRPVDIRIQEPSLLSPPSDSAVCSGNVETSQRIVDVLLGAFGAAAASQGTMNNVTFGNATFGYYETIAGGAGAGPSFAGAHCVHTHMTNTRITDPEVLESRYPVRLRKFARRPQSGGVGRYLGGMGCIREYEFLAPLSVTLVGERRRSAPFGLDGGGAGAPGHHSLNGQHLPGRCEFNVQVGDVLRIETPGGGGYGAP